MSNIYQYEYRINHEKTHPYKVYYCTVLTRMRKIINKYFVVLPLVTFVSYKLYSKYHLHQAEHLAIIETSN